MVWKKILIISLISCCFSSCLNYYHHPNGGYRPKKSKFYLQNSPYRIKKTDKLKTNVIYVLNDTLIYGNNKDVLYLRFFNNGRCYRSIYSLNKVINTKEINTPTTVGYYAINNNTNIELEFFPVRYKERGIYLKSNGFIKNDTLFINGTDEKGQSQNYIYTPKKIEKLTQKTDW